VGVEPERYGDVAESAERSCGSSPGSCRSLPCLAEAPMSGSRRRSRLVFAARLDIGDGVSDLCKLALHIREDRTSRTPSVWPASPGSALASWRAGPSPARSHCWRAPPSRRRARLARTRSVAWSPCPGGRQSTAPAHLRHGYGSAIWMLTFLPRPGDRHPHLGQPVDHCGRLMRLYAPHAVVDSAL
jgi:hypothetical protein